jgi:8-oxo-dGTP diphosphatase
VGVFIIQNSKVLLAKRAIEPFKGWWDSIGGFMEIEESPQETALREVKEETGLDIELIEIIGTTKDQYNDEHIVPISFIGRIISGVPKPADDVEKLRWFSIDRLPKNIAFNCNKIALDLLKQRLKGANN